MKVFRNNINLAAILATLLVIISLGSIYFFIYLPHNERNLQEQRFRALQNIDKNIHEKIENSVALLNNLLSSYQEKLKDPAGSAEAREYINGYSKENFILIPIKEIDFGKGRDSLDSVYTIDINNSAKQIILSFRKKLAGPDSIGHEIGMKFSFEQFIKILLPKDVFDQYVFFSNQKPFYETFPAGISEIREDSLLGAKTGMKTSGVRNYNIGGKDYKLFLQPVSVNSGKDWIIGGLLSNSRYQREKNQLPSEIILLLLTLVISMLLMFPVIKLFQMGNKDRLTISDGIWSIVTSMLLMSLLFFSFFKYNISLRPDVNPDSKKILTDGISQAFKKEINTVYHALCRYDTLLQKDSLKSKSLRSDIIFLQSNKIYNDDKKEIKDLADTLKAIGKTVSIKQVFWLNDSGVEKLNWTIESANAPHRNYKVRDYFKRIRDKNTYFLNDDISKQFYLDQIISWTTGEFTSVLSIPSLDTGKVAVISFNMKSLENVLLPPGYQFALIDDRGNVLYHSQEDRNLKENLLDEFSENENLLSCMQAHTDSSFETRYFSKKYNVRVSPLTGLPYFLVILEDTSFMETRHIEIYSFTSSMLIIFFIFLIIELLITFFASAKRSFFKKHLFDTSWLGPKESCHEEYILAAAFNFIIVLLLIFFFFLTSFLTYLFILFISVIAVNLFLNVAFANRYKSENPDKYDYKKKAIRCLIILIAIIDITAIIKLDQWYNSLPAYELFVFITGVIVLKAGKLFLDKLKGPKQYAFLKRWNNVKSFSLMALTRLIITSGIPIVFFYLSSYNYEQNIAIRYKQSEFAKQLIQKAHDISSGDLKYIKDTLGIYIDGASIKDIDTVQITDVSKFRKDSLKFEGYTDEEKQALKILGAFRLSITHESVAEEKFYSSEEEDSSLFYNHLLRDACQTSAGTITYKHTNLPYKYLKISSSCLNYNLPGFFRKGSILNGLEFWIFLIFSLVIFYFIIHNIIKKLFAVGVPDLKKSHEVDIKILEDQKLNKLLFIIGSPGARKKDYVLQLIKLGKIKSPANKALAFDSYLEMNNNVFIADMIHIPDSGNEKEEELHWKKYMDKVFAEKNSLIIVNHFEYNIQDPVSNRIKLNFLEKLMIDDKRKIIILSTIHPVTFLDSAFTELMKKNNKSTGKNDKNITTIPAQDLEKWHVLLGHYRIVLMSLDHDMELTVEKPHEKIIGGDSSLDHEPNLKVERLYEEMIYKETKRGYFLNQMRQPAIEAGREILKNVKKEELPPLPDEIVLKLQVTSHYFYMYIWQSLTREEKFLLYDLAEDNLVNSFDDYNLSMLIGKGIIMRDDGTLKLFNNGFRNFIITAIGDSEAMKIKDQIKDNGNWGKLRIPMILIILAILAFLLVSQQEAYSTLITYLAALTAGVPLVLRIFSFFDKTKKPSEIDTANN